MNSYFGQFKSFNVLFDILDIASFILNSKFYNHFSTFPYLSSYATSIGVSNGTHSFKVE